jgi:hypothetical protein
MANVLLRVTAKAIAAVMALATRRGPAPDVVNRVKSGRAIQRTGSRGDAEERRKTARISVAKRMRRA